MKTFLLPAWIPLLALVAAGCDFVPTPVIDRADTQSARVEGRVAIPDRADASGIQVYIAGEASVSITGPEGRYALGGVGPGRHVVLARAEGFPSQSIGEADVPDPPAGIRLTLPDAVLRADDTTTGPTAGEGATGQVEGRVRLAWGGAGAATDWSACRIELEATPFRTTCDAGGEFLLWNIPAARYVLRAQMQGYAPTTRTVEVEAGGTTGPIVLALEPAVSAEPPGPADEPAPAAARGAEGNRRLTGLVEMRNARGEPTSDFHLVTVQLVGRPGRAVVAASDGTFTFEGLAPERYVVQASAPGYVDSPPVEVDLADVPEMAVQLRMTAGAGQTPAGRGGLAGVAVKGDAAADADMSGITVVLTGTGHSAVTGPEGRFAIANIAAGQYMLLARAEGYQEARVGPVTIAEGQLLEVEPIVLGPQVDRPRVVETVPGDGARVPLEAAIPILIRFDRRMRPGSVADAIQIAPPVAFEVFSGPELAGADPDVVQVLIAGTGVDPAARFNTLYRLRITESATDYEGRCLARQFEMSFRTGGPGIIETWPPEGGVKQSLAPEHPVEFWFNTRIDPVTINSDAIRVRPRLRTDPSVQYLVDPGTGWTVLRVVASWERETVYRLSLQRGLRTEDREQLSNLPFTLTFRTPDMVLFDPPRTPATTR